jgi:hypothetical protein
LACRTSSSLQWRLSIAAKYLYEYYAEDRFRGHALTGLVAYQF